MSTDSSDGFFVCVGDTVHWYPGGSVDCDPYPALVLQVNNGKMLTLNVYNPETGQPSYRRNVWPVGHQAVRDNPMLLSQYGAWTHTRWRAQRDVSQETSVFPTPVETPVDPPPAEKPRLQKKMDTQPA